MLGRKSVNPFLVPGSYLGLAAGFLLFAKGWHIFGWLPAFFGVNISSLLFLDCAGGFLAGYILHILFRIYEWDDGWKFKSKKKDLPPKI